MKRLNSGRFNKTYRAISICILTFGGGKLGLAGSPLRNAAATVVVKNDFSNMSLVTPKDLPTLREKIGQMLLVGFRGTSLSSPNAIFKSIAGRHLGAVLLFDEETGGGPNPRRNMESPQQVRSLIASLQTLAGGSLWVALDQEGGGVNRLKPSRGFRTTLSAKKLGEGGNVATTYAAATETAETLASLGINFNLAPVVDLDFGAASPVIGGKERSFSSDPEQVARHAAEVVRAHHERRIATCLKHFPGHGSARADTHLGWVDATSVWDDRELLPFQRLIEAGACDAIMVAHLYNSTLDADQPATLSKRTITGLLRGSLKFDGVVVSDDLQMRALLDHRGFDETVALAISAGIDLLCFANNSVFDSDIVEKATEAVLRALESGAVVEGRLNESFERIQKLKRRFSDPEKSSISKERG